MKRIVFDIEANGLLEIVDQVWCICTHDVDTKEKRQFGPDELWEGLKYIATADVLIGHNIIGYDLPALNKVIHWRLPPNVIVRDTLIFGSLCFSDIRTQDLASPRVDELERKGLIGSQSLKAWGIRLGEYKSEFGKHAGENEDVWDHFSQEMLDYCSQDTTVCAVLYQYLLGQGVAEEAIDLEHRFAVISEAMCRHGIYFDYAGAIELTNHFRITLKEMEQSLQSVFPGETYYMKKPKYWIMSDHHGEIHKRKTKGELEALRRQLGYKPAQCRLVAGPPEERVKHFNPGSRKQIREQLQKKFGWVSPTLTKTGEKLMKKAQSEDIEAVQDDLSLDYGEVTEETLKAIGHHEEVKTLIDYLITNKTYGALANGPTAWIKRCARNNRVYHHMRTIGCATMRCSHANFNISQVPAVLHDRTTGEPIKGVRGRWGFESRSLFLPSPGYVMVGVDLQGIEARLLAHFLCPFDGGKYIDVVLNGDIHQMNVDALKKFTTYDVSRSDSKPLFYGWCYGAGDVKLGWQLAASSQEARDAYDRFVVRKTRGGLPAPVASEHAYRHLGRGVRRAFEGGIDGMGTLIEAVQEKAKRGFLTPLDKRRIPVRAEHKALNTLLQGSAAIVMKRWTVMCWEEVRRRELDAHLLLIAHDEHQAEVNQGQIQEYSDLSISCIKKAGVFYKLYIGLDGESKTGSCWAETH